jgi:hypothetical protein
MKVTVFLGSMKVTVYLGSMKVTVYLGSMKVRLARAAVTNRKVSSLHSCLSTMLLLQV